MPRAAYHLSTFALAAALLLGGARQATAQFNVTQVQPLAFGYLTQGVTEVVPYTDTFRRGVVSIDGLGNAYVRVTMPTVLTSATGATIPLQFLFGDLAEQDAGHAPTAFDPAASTRVNLNKGTGYLFLGGRALPATTQSAGNYSATVVVMVSLIKF